MRPSPTIRAARSLLATVVLCGGAAAQSQPLPHTPAPEQPHEQKPDCSEKGVKGMEEQVATLESLAGTAPETIALLCQGFDTVSGLMGWKDDEPIDGPLNDLARKLLRQQLTPRMVKAMCRQAQGEAGRNLLTEIGRLKERLASCKGI